MGGCKSHKTASGRHKVESDISWQKKLDLIKSQNRKRSSQGRANPDNIIGSQLLCYGHKTASGHHKVELCHRFMRSLKISVQTSHKTASGHHKVELKHSFQNFCFHIQSQNRKRSSQGRVYVDGALFSSLCSVTKPQAVITRSSPSTRVVQDVVLNGSQNRKRSSQGRVCHTLCMTTMRGI